MGGSGSTRRVVVEDARGEDVVTISEAVVRRLQGQPEAYEAIPETKPTAPPQFFKPETFESKSSSLLTKDEEDFFTQKLQELQQRNAALQKLTNEEFAKAVQEVEEKFVKTTSSPICQDLQLKVIECYQANPTEVLNCASVVDAFTTCVERARTTLLPLQPNITNTLYGSAEQLKKTAHFFSLAQSAKELTIKSSNKAG